MSMYNKIKNNNSIELIYKIYPKYFMTSIDIN